MFRHVVLDRQPTIDTRKIRSVVLRLRGQHLNAMDCIQTMNPNVPGLEFQVSQKSAPRLNSGFILCAFPK